MSDNKSKKMPGILARLRMVVGLNIGTIMFGILFIYMAFSAILYFTTTHIESYQVTSGPLSRNETYTGLAIRERCTDLVIQKQLLLRHLLPRKNFQRYGLI